LDLRREPFQGLLRYRKFSMSCSPVVIDKFDARERAIALIPTRQTTKEPVDYGEFGRSSKPRRGQSYVTDVRDYACARYPTQFIVIYSKCLYKQAFVY